MGENIKIDKAAKLFAQMSIDKSSQVLAKILNKPAKIELERIYMTDISQITDSDRWHESKVIGAVIDLTGEASFKYLFFAEEKASFVLTDLMLRKQIGTYKTFDKYVYSTVQEIGNILSSSVASVLSANFQISLRASPPTVIHDYAGVVFEEFIMNTAMYSDEILILESVFRVIDQDLKCNMYMIPFKGSEKVLNYIVNAQ